jgi:bifunctional non-homologous end joining protein LigD
VAVNSQSVMLAEKFEPRTTAEQTEFLTNPDCIYELKLDGARARADLGAGAAELWYRSGRSASVYFPELAAGLVARAAALGGPTLALDGELVAFDELGRPSFELLTQRLSQEGGKFPKVTYVVFDVLEMAGSPLRALPLTERRKVLELLSERGFFGESVRLHPAFDEGLALYQLCETHDLEGIVRKRKGSGYQGLRCPDWQKLKRTKEDAFWVVGYTEGEASRKSLGALVLATQAGDGSWKLAGKVGSGLSVETIATLLPRLQDTIPKCVVLGKLDLDKPARFVIPSFQVRVRYEGFSLGGSLLKPVFRGIEP